MVKPSSKGCPGSTIQTWSYTPIQLTVWHFILICIIKRRAKYSSTSVWVSHVFYLYVLQGHKDAKGGSSVRTQNRDQRRTEWCLFNLSPGVLNKPHRCMECHRLLRHRQVTGDRTLKQFTSQYVVYFSDLRMRWTTPVKHVIWDEGYRMSWRHNVLTMLSCGAILQKWLTVRFELSIPHKIVISARKR